MQIRRNGGIGAAGHRIFGHQQPAIAQVIAVDADRGAAEGDRAHRFGRGDGRADDSQVIRSYYALNGKPQQG